MIEDIFKYKSANFDKLVDYGFKLNNETYEYVTDILDGEFELHVYISKNGNIFTETFDKKSHEKYVLHLMKDALGKFVGDVRTSYENVLKDICEKCFEKDIFKSSQAREIIKYVKHKFGDDLEYLWEKFSNNAVWRRKDNKKWYGLLVSLSKKKLGINSDEVIDIIDLRIEPEKIKELVDNKSFFEGYHMNKKHWITICLDGSVSMEKIAYYINLSYNFAGKSG